MKYGKKDYATTQYPRIMEHMSNNQKGSYFKADFRSGKVKMAPNNTKQSPANRGM